MTLAMRIYRLQLFSWFVILLFVFAYVPTASAQKKNEDYYMKKGLEKEKAGKFKEAIKDFNNVLKINPKSAYGYYNRGINYGNSKQFDQALVDFNKVISLQPGFDLAYFAKAYTLIALKRPQDALATFKLFLKKSDPKDKALVERAKKEIKKLESK